MAVSLEHGFLLLLRTQPFSRGPLGEQGASRSAHRLPLPAASARQALISQQLALPCGWVRPGLILALLADLRRREPSRADTASALREEHPRSRAVPQLFQSPQPFLHNGYCSPEMEAFSESSAPKKN